MTILFLVLGQLTPGLDARLNPSSRRPTALTLDIGIQKKSLENKGPKKERLGKERLA
jgi:hypothetical protein